MPHNPNPFDFVPFTSQPQLRTPQQFDEMGERLSGYLEVRVKALTPVHVVGYQTKTSEVEGDSYFYRQNGTPCIPAATIRGCLRAFIEALTSGWVSQANLDYPKKYGGPGVKDGRHIGFRVFEEVPPDRQQTLRRTSPPAVDPGFEPRLRDDRQLDVASYLFGMVLEPKTDEEKEHAELARKSKVFIEDAYLPEEALETGKSWVPDVAGSSFMGGGKPSASNWWYMKPKEIWKRKIEHGDNINYVAEFIGEKYRGRKFYYHQDPRKCVQFYKPQNYTWPYNEDNPFCKVKLETLKSGGCTDTFRIYVNQIPRRLLILLVKSLFPGDNIRHKLGYGKAYGYGSIEFILQAVRLREDGENRKIPGCTEDKLDTIVTWIKGGWYPEHLNEIGFDTSLLDWNALAWFARILGWQDHDKLLFTYPPFLKGYIFGIPLKYKSKIENGVVSQDIREEFEKHGVSLSNTSTFRRGRRRSEWRIIDETRKGYTILVGHEALHICGIGNFSQPIQFGELEKRAEAIEVSIEQNTSVDRKQAEKIARRVFNLKKTIHFRLYQEKATGWEIIKTRLP